MKYNTYIFTRLKCNHVHFLMIKIIRICLKIRLYYILKMIKTVCYFFQILTVKNNIIIIILAVVKNYFSTKIRFNSFIMQ